MLVIKPVLRAPITGKPNLKVCATSQHKFHCQGGEVLGSSFAGDVPQASQNPHPIIVYSVANYRPHLPTVKEPFLPHGRGLVTIVYAVKRSFQFDMKQDTCHVKGRKFTCKVWRTSWKRTLNHLFAVL